MDAALGHMAKPYRAWWSENLSRRASKPDMFHCGHALVTLSKVTKFIPVVAVWNAAGETKIVRTRCSTSLSKQATLRERSRQEKPHGL